MANLMELVRELKMLNKRRKAGEKLNAADDARRVELKEYLRHALEGQGVSAEDTGPQVPVPKPASMPTGAPVPVVAVVTPTAASAQQTTGSHPPVPPLAATPISTAVAFPPRAVAPPAGEAAASVPPIASAGPVAPDAVAKVDPYAGKQARASRTEIDEAEAAAERALKATRTRERPRSAEEAAVQLQQIDEKSGYTPPATAVAEEPYFGGYGEEGYAVVTDPPAGLLPIDPREAELYKAGLVGPNARPTLVVPRGLVFLDDFSALYQRGLLTPSEDEVVVDKADPNMLIPGKRKVTVHLLNGEKRMGAIREMRRGDLGFSLEQHGSGSAESMSITQVKAVFIHAGPHSPAQAVAGRSLTVTFRDARTVQGNSEDYAPGAPVFTLVPGGGRGQFERIIVNGAAVTGVQ